MPVWLIKYWKVALLALLLGAVAYQTVRLSAAKVTIEKQKTAAAQFETDIATKRAEGVAEGARLQREAQAVIDAQKDSVVAGLIADAKRRQKDDAARTTKFNAALTAARWQCLRDPLPEAVLDDYRQ